MAMMKVFEHALVRYLDYVLGTGTEHMYDNKREIV
jgi:hypothetical protein